MKVKPIAYHGSSRQLFWAKSFKGKSVLESIASPAKALTSVNVLPRYPLGMVTLPHNPEAALLEGERLLQRLIQERFGGKGEVLGWRKSVEGEDYAIYVKVPVDIYRDIDLTLSVAAEVIALSDRLRVPFFAYFIPSEDAA